MRNSVENEYPSPSAFIQRERREKLKVLLPWILPTSGALGWLLVFGVPRLKATFVNLTGFLPTRLLGFLPIVIIAAWICMTLACSAWTSFRYFRRLKHSPGEAAIRGMCVTPLLCCVHFSILLIA